ncbi:hypothetical protein SODALDRAFT_381358 [Sodiomyces alkalinus F11]|uniref:DUF6546 domain-containing protein n=1 Tax=Sodiomyces alkalinus (strain CBS 110278 / VKM F-3762 / F11) TaxID=1314773 RepID=A0A3N2PP25_SODAK|nr:hypothetical protein SODALDRAFT_381358 [Sodiomyces alkalinus F11]ROT36106.1 hypothetical protein SODALDRAFT_381358 [Sodiomyces alkalinus F11]
MVRTKRQRLGWRRTEAQACDAPPLRSGVDTGTAGPMGIGGRRWTTVDVTSTFAMACWNTCPLEVKEMIWRVLSRHPISTAAYAAVSRNWQEFFEKKHFKTILLSPRRVLDFSRILQEPRKRKLVRHIWLRIELLSYDCPSCEETERWSESQQNNAIGMNMEKPRDRDEMNPDLTLELSAYSPSDSQHAFPWYNFAHDPYSEPGHQFGSSALPTLQTPPPSSPRPLRHINCIGPRVRSDRGWTLLNKWRLYGLDPGLDIVPRDKRAFVDVVTTLLVRRQSFRQISLEALASLAGHHLSGLQRIHLEPHEATEFATTVGRCLTPHASCLVLPADSCPPTGYNRFFTSALPDTLRELVIFEDNDKHIIGLKQSLYSIIHRYREAGRIGRALAACTRHLPALEHLSVSFVADARGFFNYFSSPQSPPVPLTGPPWRKLRSLALTASDLQCGARDTPDPMILRLLRGAATVALTIDSLRILELWNGAEDDMGCVFRYQFDDKDTGEGTWTLVITEEVEEAWREVARRRSTRPLKVHRQIMTLDDGTWFPLSVLRHLHLRDRVIHPMSFRQINEAL